jgi:hypothetical protein
MKADFQIQLRTILMKKLLQFILLPNNVTNYYPIIISPLPPSAVKLWYVCTSFLQNF